MDIEPAQVIPMEVKCEDHCDRGEKKLELDEEDCICW